jgi:lipid II:glycine glycyltransferase (peptidoglycan interpeptide bridge formation enzyme)
VRVKSVTIQEWQQFVECLADYSFFQLPIWAQAYEKTYPNYKIATKLFTFDDGVEVLVPLVKVKHKFGLESLKSLPRGGYGGFLWSKKPTEGQVQQLLDKLLNKRVLHLEMSPSPWDLDTCEFLENYGLKNRITFTHTIKLDKPEVVWRNLTRNCRRNIKRAERENLKILEGKFDDLRSSYYKMYRHSAKRWDLKGKDIIPLEFFENLTQIGRERVKVLFVEKEGQKIAGVIIGYGKRESIQWHSVYLHEYENVRPNNLWEWELIRDAYERGYKIHNFGSSEGLPGVQRFKESFGAEKLDYKIFIYSSQLLKVYRKARLLVSGGRGALQLPQP